MHMAATATCSLQHILRPHTSHHHRHHHHNHVCVYHVCMYPHRYTCKYTRTNRLTPRRSRHAAYIRTRQKGRCHETAKQSQAPRTVPPPQTTTSCPSKSLPAAACAHACASRHRPKGCQASRGVHCVCVCAQGARRLGSRGNMEVLRMLSSPRYSITTRSRPTPAPPWGGAPRRKESM